MEKIDKFIKRFEIVFTLILATLLFGSGMLFLIIGRSIYGSDASLLWVSGILTYLGIQGFVSVLLYISNNIKKKPTKMRDR